MDSSDTHSPKKQRVSQSTQKVATDNVLVVFLSGALVVDANNKVMFQGNWWTSLDYAQQMHSESSDQYRFSYDMSHHNDGFMVMDGWFCNSDSAKVDDLMSFKLDSKYTGNIVSLFGKGKNFRGAYDIRGSAEPPIYGGLHNMKIEMEREYVDGPYSDGDILNYDTESSPEIENNVTQTAFDDNGLFYGNNDEEITAASSNHNGDNELGDNHGDNFEDGECCVRLFNCLPLKQHNIHQC